jgi:hypothetical protein
MTVTKYPEKAFEDIPKYRQEVKDFNKKYNLSEINLKTKNGQGFCLMLYNYPNPIKGRPECDLFFDKIGMLHGDSIQPFNKWDQRGFKQPKTRAKYSITYPFEYSIKKKIRIKRKEVLDEKKKTEQVNMQKEYINDLYNEPVDKYQRGHKNPDRGYTEDNMMWQPSHQAKVRNEWIFYDHWNPLKCIPNPTHKNFEKNMEEMNFTEEQYKKMFSFCKKKLKKEIIEEI